MDWLNLDYRDPILGLFFIIFLIFISSFLTYSYTLYRQKRNRVDVKKFLKRFESNRLKEVDYIHLYKSYNLPFDSILLLATTFIKEGKYNKAINIYINLLEVVEDKVKKEEILYYLANTYFKGGFLQRAREVFLKILKHNPHHKDALKKLLLIYEKLGDFKKAVEVLESLEEQNSIVVKDKIFILLLKTINDPILSIEEKKEQILNYFKLNKTIGRLVANFLIMYDKKLFWEKIDNFDKEKIIDLLWELDKKDIDFSKVKKDIFLKEIYSAKGYIDDVKKSNIFEFGIMIALNNSSIKVDIDLKFEYICKNCKNIMPIYSNRCPKCNSILSFIVKPIISKPINHFVEGLV